MSFFHLHKYNGPRMQAVNPYIAGSPVTGSEMFFGRADVFTFVQEALVGQHRDNVIILYGERRTGKTSALYQMGRHLGPRYLCVFIDLHGLALDGLDGFLWELANTITRTLYRVYEIKLPPPPREAFAADARGYFENEFLNQVWVAIGDRHLLLMLDEAIRLQEQVQAGKLGREIFEYLRHLMQHYERLNFVFALGRGLEEMAQEYTFLFSVGLYKKISYLERETALALITLPVEKFYQVEPAAGERILQITAGHPYYIQMLCHSLFNRWLHTRAARIGVQDVDAVLDEVIERGLSVLKHIWEESSPAEKAVLAGAAAATEQPPQPVSALDIARALTQYNIRIPPDEMAQALKSLCARDVLTGQDPYYLTVDLQRRWIDKYERLEWVRDEIGETIRRWTLHPALPAAPKPPPPPFPKTPPAGSVLPGRRPARRRWPVLPFLLGGAVLLLLVAAFALFSASTAQQGLALTTPTATPVRATATRPAATPTLPPSPAPALPTPTTVFGAGTRILFSSGTPGCSSIGLLNLDTGAVTTFNPAPNDEEPSWAPDGSHFVASTGDCNNDKYALTAFSLDGTATRLKTSCDKNIDASWGSDNRIYFACGPKADNGDLYTINPDGSGLRALGLTGRRPTLSPDGTHLAYMRNEKAGWRIWVARVTVDGKLTNQVPLPFPQVLGGVYARQARWSSDGARLFFNVTDKTSLQAIALASVELATNNTNVAFITAGTNTPFVRPACGRNNVCIAGGVNGGLWLLEDVNGALTPRRQLTSGEEFGADVYP
ncbi:MAG: AAA family ATPase [Anaerolineae bacterium]